MTTPLSLPQRTHALIIGIGSYRDSSIAPLQFTNSDASAFAAVLADESVCGVPAENIRLLVDEAATLLEIKKAISGWLAKRAEADSTAIIFWAGHGDVEPDPLGRSTDGIANYLLPYDVDRENLFASALSREEFERLIGTVRSKRRVVFMDACHSGGVAMQGSRKVGVGYSRDFFETIAQGSGSMVIAAAEHNQLSWEDATLGHGVFTYHLLEALRGKADSDGDGRVTMNEVYEYLKRSVPESVRRLGKGEQRPVLSSQVSGDIVLTINRQRMQEVSEEERRRAEAERERVAGLRRELLRLHTEHSLGADAYGYAYKLAAKPLAELSVVEGRLMTLMQGMFASPSLVPFFEEQYAESLVAPERAVPPPVVEPVPFSKPVAPEPRPQPQPQPPPVYERPVPVASSVSKDMDMGMKVLAFVVPFVSGIMGLVYMQSSDAEKKKAGRSWLTLSAIAFGVYFVLGMVLGSCAAMLEGGYY